jgi:hypothetical protein
VISNGLKRIAVLLALFVVLAPSASAGAYGESQERNSDPSGDTRVSTERVSVRSGGGQANAGADNIAVSRNGRYVAFTSSADNLIRCDSNESWDVFVRNRRTNTIIRVSVEPGVDSSSEAAGSLRCPPVVGTS